MATGAPRQGFLSRLLPASGSEQFFDLLEAHADRTREAAALLAEMLAKQVDAAQQAERVKAVEHQGDEITHAVIERLHQTFITPIDRDDMHRLISRMDDVLDQSVQAVGDAVRCLRDLRDREALIAHCTEINRLENEGDQLLRRAVARLFHDSTDPIHVIKWKEIYDNLENAIDRCEDVANVIEGVALEYA